MSIYIKNYGFTKTSIQKNNKKSNNEIKWTADYDGKMANLDVAINDGDHHKEELSMQLDNNDLMHLLGYQPVNMSLEDRLTNDFMMKDDDLLEGESINKRLSKKKHSKKAKKGKKGSKTRTRTKNKN